MYDSERKPYFRNILIIHGILKMASSVCREVNEVREERLRRRECDRLKRERETNKERQRRFVNLFPRLSLLSIHILVMANHINWLGEEQMMEKTCRVIRRAKGGSIFINIILFSSSYCFTV